MKTYLKNILFAFLTTLILFFTLEILSQILCFACPELRGRLSSPKNIYEYDRRKVYRLKKNFHGRFWGKTLTTNSLGYRDTEHALHKEKELIRILALGDSVTFGPGVNSPQTYPKQLEKIMSRKLIHPVEVINTGVPGYSTFQEYFDLEQGLAFQPDIVTIQFVLNDVVEPYVIYKRYTGRGIDYRRVKDTWWLNYWLADHSKLYFLLGELFIHIRFKTLDRSQIFRRAQQQQQQVAWERGAEASFTQDGKVKEAWRECLKWMKKIADLCHKKNIACILVITPFEFQMFDLSKTFAQITLKEFAENQGIECIDVLPLIQEKARAEIIEKYSLKKDLPYKALIENYSDDIKKVWRKYFLDHDHMTPKGHRLVADTLYPYVYRLLVKKRVLNLRKSPA